MNLPWLRIAKGVIGGLLCLLLLSTVSTWWGDYRTASIAAKAEQIATAQLEASATAAVNKKQNVKDTPKSADSEKKPSKDQSKRKSVIVLRDGLNFRSEPSAAGEKYQPLDKGEKLMLLKTQDGWYQVENDQGLRGWVSALPKYTKLQ